MDLKVFDLSEVAHQAAGGLAGGLDHDVEIGAGLGCHVGLQSWAGARARVLP